MNDADFTCSTRPCDYAEYTDCTGRRVVGRILDEEGGFYSVEPVGDDSYTVTLAARYVRVVDGSRDTLIDAYVRRTRRAS